MFKRIVITAMQLIVGLMIGFGLIYAEDYGLRKWHQWELEKQGMISEYLCNFQSVQDLNTWLEKDHTEKAMRDLYCADRAELLVKSAEENGYRLNIEALSSNETRKYKPDYQGDAGHIAVTAVIGNTLYLIEPSSDEVWEYGELVRGEVQ